MNPCETCDHAREQGCWPDDLLHRGGTHCMECHRSWTSKSQSHCTVCHRHFGSDAAGDNHRFGDYRKGRRPVCRDPQGSDRWETPEGPLWGGRDPVLARERLARNFASTRPAYEEFGSETQFDGNTE